MSSLVSRSFLISPRQRMVSLFVRNKAGNSTKEDEENPNKNIGKISVGNGKSPHFEDKVDSKGYSDKMDEGFGREAITKAAFAFGPESAFHFGEFMKEAPPKIIDGKKVE